MSGPVRLGLVAALLGLGAAGATALPAEQPRTPAEQQVPVRGTVVVCPEAGPGTRLVVGGAGAAALTGGALGGPASPLRPGPVELGEPGGTPWVVRAAGAGAAGLVAEQATVTTGGSGRGLATAACVAPSTSSWFVGAATTVGSTSELVLVNVDDASALVDVTTWTSTGPGDPRPGRGLVVPPRGRLVVPLDRLAPDREGLSLHVRTARGRVAAAVRVLRADGRTPRGTDWLPPTAAPAREAVVPGLPAGPGNRTLLVTNPGQVAVSVSVVLTTDDGQLEAVPLEVPAGSTAPLDLSEQLRGTPAAAHVRSDGAPVLAGAAITDEARPPARETSYAAAVPALEGTVQLALAQASEVLLLSALEVDGAVEVGTTRIEVPAATTVVVPLRDLLPEGAPGLPVRVLQGRVHAARWTRDSGRAGLLVAGLPLRPVVPDVRRPAVVADPGAGR